ncbi:MAG: stress response translation initiation inhibitor YciH [Gammaproteobacteria bacterium]|nr:stress response translation initiation inhibitor YciH [Gammaproteobacteria bacterium]
MKNSRPVYSTETGKLCPGCGYSVNACQCKKGKLNSEGDGIIRLSRETKGRKGKGVTLVNGVQGSEAELKALGKRLKQICGTGGTVKNSIIEIQGDVREKIKLELENMGHKVKLAGG